MTKKAREKEQLGAKKLVTTVAMSVAIRTKTVTMLLIRKIKKSYNIFTKFINHLHNIFQFVGLFIYSMEFENLS